MIDRKTRRKFGQNYLKDPAVLFEMGEAISPAAGDHFFEIGPGMGALTKGFKSTDNRSTPESILKYETFFKMIHSDAEHSKGIKIMQYENPISGIVDFVTVSFDLRILQTEQNLMQSNFIANQNLTANQMNVNEQAQIGQQ